jgi:hypothetical protein
MMLDRPLRLDRFRALTETGVCSLARDRGTSAGGTRRGGRRLERRVAARRTRGPPASGRAHGRPSARRGVGAHEGRRGRSVSQLALRERRESSAGETRTRREECGGHAWWAGAVTLTSLDDTAGGGGGGRAARHPRTPSPPSTPAWRGPRRRRPSRFSRRRATAPFRRQTQRILPAGLEPRGRAAARRRGRTRTRRGRRGAKTGAACACVNCG